MSCKARPSDSNRKEHMPDSNQSSGNPHTPGPWRIHTYKTPAGKPQTIIQADFANVCRMDIAGRNPLTLAADAALISAAPDLLIALQSFIDAAPMGQGGGCLYCFSHVYSSNSVEQHSPDCLLEVGRKAIAKATGGEL